MKALSTGSGGREPPAILGSDAEAPLKGTRVALLRKEERAILGSDAEAPLKAATDRLVEPSLRVRSSAAMLRPR